MLEINTNDEQQIKYLKTEQQKIVEEKLNKGFYDDNDVYMVRTSNYINTEKVIYPICDVPFVVQTDSMIKSALTDAFDKIEKIDMFVDSEKYEQRKKTINKIVPLSTQYRSTVHFSLNGLVSSHNKGNFENQNFIIIDKINSHLKTDNICALRIEDTYIEGKVQLSDNVVVLINKNRYEELLKQNPQLNNYEIILFDGDEKTAVEIYLTTKGVAVEEIQSHGADTNTKTWGMLSKYINDKSDELGILSVPHNISKNYVEDDQKSVVLWDYYNELFYSYLLDKINYDETNKSFMLEKLVGLNFFKDEDSEFLNNLISNIGLDKFIDICNEFNENILNQINNGQYKTNAQLIEELSNNKKY